MSPGWTRLKPYLSRISPLSLPLMWQLNFHGSLQGQPSGSWRGSGGWSAKGWKNRSTKNRDAWIEIHGVNVFYQTFCESANKMLSVLQNDWVCSPRTGRGEQTRQRLPNGVFFSCILICLGTFGHVSGLSVIVGWISQLREERMMMLSLLSPGFYSASISLSNNVHLLFPHVSTLFQVLNFVKDRQDPLPVGRVEVSRATCLQFRCLESPISFVWCRGRAWRLFITVSHNHFITLCASDVEPRRQKLKMMMLRKVWCLRLSC